jgi:hypothetical protein
VGIFRTFFLPAVLSIAVVCCVSGQQPAADTGTVPPAATNAAPTGDPPAAPTATADNIAPVLPVERIDKRILGVLPNYRTVQDTGNVEPIPPKRKLWIASKDSFDYPIWLTAAGFAGLYQIENENPEFGQGVKGYFKRYATSFADQSIGNMLTEGVLPSLLHEDPRYFRQGKGSVLHRTGYAVTRILVTRTDAGTNRFNFSEVLGNSLAVAFSNVYYTKDREPLDNAQKLGLQLGTDAISNVMKEFWPDIKHRFFRHQKPAEISALEF